MHTAPISLRTYKVGRASSTAYTLFSNTGRGRLTHSVKQYVLLRTFCVRFFINYDMRDRELENIYDTRINLIH